MSSSLLDTILDGIARTPKGIKMEWIKLKKEKPLEHLIVLVRSDHHGDNAFEYFTAAYFKRENEWILHIQFKQGDPYIRIYRQALKNDEWVIIE